MGNIWRKRFLNDTKAILEILEASYEAGARGIELIPVGKIIDAAIIMTERHPDYVIIGSTLPSANYGIKTLIDVNAKIIFIHGNISDQRGKNLIKLIELISDNGILPGIATHDPIPTISYTIKNDLNVRAFLVPFNKIGYLMGNSTELEKLVDSTNNFSFIAMKVLAAGKIKPQEALKYISKHNIDAVSIGMTSSQEASLTTKIALEHLHVK